MQTLPVGARLPAERHLASTYGCNFLTVRRALKALVDDGAVVRRIGSGTFVARHPGDASEGNRPSGRIGVLVCPGSNAYAYRILQAIAHAGQQLKIELSSIWVRDFAEDALQQTRQLEKDGCVALTLPWFPHERLEEVRAFVLASPLPVSLPMVIPGLEKNCFEQQSVFGGTLQFVAEAACNYFQALGHTHIALLGPDTPGDIILQKILSAYACHTSRGNFANHCGLVRPGAHAMDQLAERWQKFRGELAVVTYDDEHALRFITAMHKLGLSAPDDFRIVGHNNTEASAFSDPPLSTIPQNFDYVGAWLLRNALGLSRGEVVQSTQPPKSRLLVRATCGGLDRIDDDFRARLPDLDIFLDAGHRPVAAVC